MQKRTPLAMEMLRDATRRTRFWRTAFILAFAVIIVERITRKAV